MKHINTPEGEKKVTMDILQALAKYMVDNNVGSKYLTETKLQKIIYKTVEELELPITRCWYMRGCMVNPGGRISRFVNIDKVAYLMEFRHFYWDEDIYTCFDNIQIIDKILKVKQDNFLRDLYENMQPEKFKMEYIPNNEIIISLQGMIKGIYNSDTISNCISELSLGLYGDDIFNSIPNSFFEYLELAENTSMEIEEKAEEGYEFSLNQLEFIKSIEYNYFNTIWKLPATIISINTAEGLSAETLKRNQNNYISYGIEKIDNIFEELNEKCQELDLAIDEKSIEKAYKKSIEKIGKDPAKKINEMWKIYAR